MNAATAMSKSQRVASAICSFRMNQAYLAIAATSRYATSNRKPDQNRGVFFDERRAVLDVRVLLHGGDSLSQMEVAEDQKSEQRDATHCNHPPLRLPSLLLEGISRVEDCVSHEIP